MVAPVSRYAFTPVSRYAFTPAAMLAAQPQSLKNGRGPKELLSLVDLFRKVEPSTALVKYLGLLASGSINIRVRYASLLLLDKLLQQRPDFKKPEHLAPVRAELAKLSSDRAARTKWLKLAMLPKTDLHVHIDGSVRVETVVELAKEQGVDLAAVLEESKATPGKDEFLKDVSPLPKKPTVDQIRQLSQIQEVQPDFLKMLFLGFDFAIAVMQTKEALTRTAFELVEDSAKEGVMHLTSIIAPCLHTAEGLTYREIAEATIEGLEQGRAKYGVTWELAPAIYRGVYTELFPEHLNKTVELVKMLAKKYPGQIAIDVVGAEFQMPLADFKPQFEALKGNGVILRGHAGETLGSADNIKTAAELGLSRVGHGIQLMTLDHGAIADIVNFTMIFEVSPVSNAKCFCIGEEGQNKLEKHPIKAMIAAGAKVALCTDDRAVFAVDNIGQLLDLEKALNWEFVNGREVTKFGEWLLSQGFHGIEDNQVATTHLNDAALYFRGINQLLKLLA